MGCCASAKGTMSPARKKELLLPPPPVEEIKANDQLLERMRQISAFKCQVVSPMRLHNHLVNAHELKKAQDVLIFNIGHTSLLKLSENVQSPAGQKAKKLGQESLSEKDIQFIDDASSN